MKFKHFANEILVCSFSNPVSLIFKAEDKKNRPEISVLPAASF